MNQASTKMLLHNHKIVEKFRIQMQAFVEGKEIQYRTPGECLEWEPISSPMWDPAYEYRVKPEPKKLYEIRDKYGSLSYGDDFISMKESLTYLQKEGIAGPYTFHTYVEQP